MYQAEGQTSEEKPVLDPNYPLAQANTDIRAKGGAGQVCYTDSIRPTLTASCTHLQHQAHITTIRPHPHHQAHDMT